MISTSSEGESVRRISSIIGALLLRYQLSTGTRNAPLDNCDKSVARSGWLLDIGYRLLATGCWGSQPERQARSTRPEARSQEPEAKSETPAASSRKPAART